jgi:hypothetical protein
MIAHVDESLTEAEKQELDRILGIKSEYSNNGEKAVTAFLQASLDNRCCAECDFPYPDDELPKTAEELLSDWYFVDAEFSNNKIQRFLLCDFCYYKLYDRSTIVELKDSQAP